MPLIFDFRRAPSGCPRSMAENIKFSYDGRKFIMSQGFYKPGEKVDENHICIYEKGHMLVLPAIRGYELKVVTVRPAGNLKDSQSAKIVDKAGSTVAGGAKLTFHGNVTDSWELLESTSNTSYMIVSESDRFNIGELRLTYLNVSGLEKH